MKELNKAFQKNFIRILKEIQYYFRFLAALPQYGGSMNDKLQKKFFRSKTVFFLNPQRKKFCFLRDSSRLAICLRMKELRNPNDM